MTATELEKFLAQPHIMRIAFIDASDGTPIVHPVWYYFENKKFFIATDREGKKAKCLRKNPAIYFLIDLDPVDDPPRGVRGRATATVVDDADYATRVTQRNIDRYLGSPRGKAARRILEMGRKSCVLEVSPIYMATWKY
jgi:nitroimidazol reductase NimA-like FMN-containing flavoprotein (pyridoxamine 5'-phosphate oxidase superfamily)